jgi:antitoxin component YwqK of YwqJK toxin-antitoxin module
MSQKYGVAYIPCLRFLKKGINMKTKLLTICLLIFLSGCSEQKAIDFAKLDKRTDGLYYLPFTESEPYTGYINGEYEVFMSKGVMHGRFKKYQNHEKFLSILKKLEEEGSYNKGILHGDYKSYHISENRSLKDIGSYKFGKKHGEWKSFYKNENKKSIGSYNNGEKHEEWKGFYEDGNKSFKEKYKYGNKIGKHIEWWSNGKLKSTKKFVNGKGSGKFVWYCESSGKLEQEYDYYKDFPVGNWVVYDCKDPWYHKWHEQNFYSAGAKYILKMSIFDKYGNEKKHALYTYSEKEDTRPNHQIKNGKDLVLKFHHYDMNKWKINKGYTPVSTLDRYD